LLRGYENDRRFNDIIDDYKPYLFVPDKKGAYKTIHGQQLKKIDFPSIKDAKSFVYSMKDMANAKLCGLSRFEYLFIYDEYIRNKIDYNINLIRTFAIDIETTSRNGVPDVTVADDEVTAITLFADGKFITWGCKYYKEKTDD
jgi:hypothetical protein